MSSTTMFVIFTSALFFILSTTAHYTPCSESFYQEVLRNISHCKKLTTLGAEFGWEINESNESHRIEIIIGTRVHYEDFRWLAWGVNPRERPQMVGTRAIIGIRQLNGSLNVDTYNITSDTKLGCKLQPSDIDDVEVINKRLYFLTTINYFILHATVVLPSSVYNISRLNHVWQVGFDADGMEPKMHPTALQNVDSTETIDLTNGWGQHVGGHEHHLRMVHGILNIIGWGTFLPAGVIIARYSKYPFKFKSSWYLAHVSCQIVGYILGTTGWIIGLWLGHASRYYVFHTHRIFAMFIFTFTTLQMFALRLKPQKIDEYRKHWNMYHHFLGYALLAVISINIFQGINILKPDKTWKWAYIGILGMFALIVTTLEIYTWTKFLLLDKKSGQQNNKNSSQQQGSTADQVQPSTSPAAPGTTPGD